MDFFSDQNTRLAASCPVCRQIYNPVRMKVVEESEEAHLFHIVCERCGTQILILIAGRQMALTSRELVTELTREEVKKFKETEMVQADDVIDLHFLLAREERRVLALN